MKSKIITRYYPDGEIQKAQIVTFDSWKSLDFIQPVFNRKAFDQLCDIYQYFMVDAYPFIFGKMVLFYLPEGYKTTGKVDKNKYGNISDELTRAAIILSEGVTIQNNEPYFKTLDGELLWRDLESKGCLKTAYGRRSKTRFIPVSNKTGFLSQMEPDAAMKVNSSFFIMDFIDTATVFDHVGEAFGLMVDEGKIISPPMFDREALLVREEGIRIQKVGIGDVGISINGRKFFGEIYSRPKYKVTPPGNKDIIIVGNKVVCVRNNGRTVIPAGGYAVKVGKSSRIKPGDEVNYSGFEDVIFGIQVGNSLVIDGKKTEEFISPFYNIRRLGSTSFPPSLYPLRYDKDRAPRIALGADKDNKPILIWAEGAGKFGHVKGEESCGATLKEMSDICLEAGMYNGINLDGGGSAQILLQNQRYLKISDRIRENNEENERAVPFGLMVK